MSGSLYIYVVARDFGFAPNPFHGFCTLATCVPGIREHASIGDWIMGVGGRRLNATGMCVYLMKVSEKITFNEYWSDARFKRKRPLRNGSLAMMVGDNVYHQDAESGEWVQEDSHHSNPDGTTNHENLNTDTSSVRVLVSDNFYYFGKSAPQINLPEIRYRNHRSYSKKALSDEGVSEFIGKIEATHKKTKNLVLDDPFDFSTASKRVNQATGKIS